MMYVQKNLTRYKHFRRTEESTSRTEFRVKIDKSIAQCFLLGKSDRVSFLFYGKYESLSHSKNGSYKSRSSARRHNVFL